MTPALKIVVLALALSISPQAVPASAQPADPPSADAGRIRIIMDGRTAETAAAVEAVEIAAADPIESSPVESTPLPEADHPVVAPAEWAADVMRTPRRPGEGWRIQVGAFREQARAEARIAALETLAAGPGADPIRFVSAGQDASGAIFRAQMSGFVDRAAADGACSRIATSGAACFVISPQ